MKPFRFPMPQAFTVVLALIVAAVCPLSAQWNTAPGFPGGATDGCFSFVIDDVAFVGGGLNSSGLYAFSADTKMWEYQTDLPGEVTRVWAFAFAHDGRGYIGGGAVNGGNVTSEFYSYDPATKEWTLLAPFGGGSRDGCWAFVVNDKAYVGTGFDGQFIQNDWFEYDFATDIWTSKGMFPGGSLLFSSSFVLNGKGYVVGGGMNTESDKLFEYDPVSNSWSERTPFGGGPRQAGMAFALEGLGYFGAGMTGYTTTYQDMWTYDPAADEWSALAHDYPTEQSAWGVAFAIRGKGYVGTGASFAGQGVTTTDAFFSWPYEAPVPSAALSVDEVDFGDVTVGESGDATIRVHSLTDAELEVLSIGFDDAEAAAKGFTVTPEEPVPTTLSGLGQLPVKVSFAPGAVGLAETTLTITTNDPNTPTISVPISGRGAEALLPVAVVSEGSLDFGTVEVGKFLNKTLTVEPANEAGLQVTEAMLEMGSLDVSVATSPSLPVTLSLGQTLTIELMFAPSDSGTLTDNLIITTNESEPTHSIELSGHAVRPASSVRSGAGLEAFQVNVSPNPADRMLRIDIGEFGGSECRIRILDVRGASVHDGPISSNRRSVDVDTSALPAGTYYLELSTDRGPVVRRIVVER